jgi:transposase
MGKSPSLSPTKRAQIVAFRKTGMSQVAICKQLNVSRCAVQNALLKFDCGGGYRDAARCGRPKKTTVNDDRVIRRTVVRNPKATTADAQRELLAAGVRVHRSTISRRLKAMDLQAFKAAKKPLLTVAMRRKRLEFAKAYRHWTADDWGRVLWSDESSITQFGHTSPYVRRPLGTRYVSKYTQATVKHPPSIMIWGCISVKGRGGLEILAKNVRMDSKLYIDILEKKLENFMIILDCNLFMQDSAPCHVSKASMEWFRRHKIQTLEWPGNSPDLNPIENVWRKVKDLVGKRMATSLPELETAIKSVWTTEITPEYCAACVNSMPSRVQAVLDAKGGPTKY